MKTFLSLLGVTWLLALSPVLADERQSVSLDFFYDNLEPYGSWREIGDLGYCWQPGDVQDDWRPYSDGRWVYTDAGWTWDSEEPYGWAVYHYGRWANVENVGWVWVPGTEWGPGWVSWRHSPRYVGWAPLPPEAVFRVDIGLNAWVDDYYDIGPSSYRFVEGHNFGARRLNTVFIDQRENISIIHQTTNITNITYVNNTVHNGGLRYDQQFRQSADPIPRYKLDRRQSFDRDDRQPVAERLRSRVSGDSLSVFAAPFSDHASSAPKKASQRIDQAQVDRGWSKAGSPAQLNALREQMRSRVRPPENLPPRAKSERSKSKEEPAVQDRMGADRSRFDLGLYVFARADGRAVGHNIFLDGNTFGDSHSVDRNLFVADLSVGVAINYKNTKLAYAFVYRTKEFSDQQDAQVFGTVSLNWTF